MLWSHRIDCSVQSDGDRGNVLYVRRENLLRTSTMVMMVVIVVVAMTMVMSMTVMMMVMVPATMMMPVDSASSL